MIEFTEEDLNRMEDEVLSWMEHGESCWRFWHRHLVKYISGPLGHDTVVRNVCLQRQRTWLSVIP
jgi:hypothetical protein